MPKIKKKGTSGQAKNFITRTQAVRKLQISLPDFRRLCIFKGIYPREPRNKKKASKSATPSTTFYYTKDIQYLLHEPLLQKFRDHNALAKKIGRYLGRGEASDAARLEKTQTPRLTLDHIIKERYPTFIDALRDLDDALSMLFLFANLPSTTNIPPKTIALCQRLCLEFEHYLIITHSLRKSFLSIKGIYYQATIQGQDILWLVPYKFVQRISGDIDFRIMGTFVEFYTTLLGFVNYRLYTSVGLLYPPKFNPKSDESGGELGAYTLQGRGIEVENDQHQGTNGTSDDAALLAATSRAQAAADTLNNLPPSSLPDPTASTAEDDDDPTAAAADSNTIIDKFPTSTSSDVDTLPQPGPSSNEAATLFANTSFYLSRETPRQPLEFLLKAFGCKRVGWDAVLGDGAFTTDEADGTITHQVVDRPPPVPTSGTDDTDENSTNTALLSNSSRGGRYPNRTYIQPQWVWDSVNAGKLGRPDLYAPGATLPPHLSPFVKAKPGQYDPTQPLEEQVTSKDVAAMQVDAEEEDGIEDSDVDSEDADDAIFDKETTINGSRSLPQSDNTAAKEDGTADDALTSFSGFSSDEDGATKKERRAEKLAKSSKETQGPKGAKPLKSALKKPTAAQKAEQERLDQLERRKMMASRSKRKLYEKMEYSNNKRDEEKERLSSKRRRIEGKAA